MPTILLMTETADSIFVEKRIKNVQIIFLIDVKQTVFAL